MPDLRRPQREGTSYFANAGDGDLLSGIDHTLESEMEHNERVLYGEHFVSKESFRFLTALQGLFDKQWIEDNVGFGHGSIRLDEEGDILAIDCALTEVTTLPELPVGLKVLLCYNTPLTVLPKLPDGLGLLNCSDTPLAKDPLKRAKLKAECKAKGIQLTI